MTLGSHVTEFSHKNRIGDLVLTGDVGPHIYGMKEQALSYSMFQSLSTLIADGLLSDNPEFVLYMFDEGFVYNVVPIKLSFSRNSRNKIGLQYDLAFKLFGTVDAVITINEPAIAKKAIDQTWLDKASKQISETMARLQSIAANINSFQASVVKITNKIVSSIQDAIDTCKAVSESLIGVVMLPARFQRMLAAQLGRVLSMLADIKHTYNLVNVLYVDQFAGEVYEVLNYIATPSSNRPRMVDSALIVDGLDAASDSIYIALMALNASANEAYGRADSWIVREGDTLIGIAGQALGNTSRWEEIASLNDLRSPYIDPRGGQGVARIGDVLRLPTVGEPIAVSIGRADEKIDTIAYGKDLRLDDGDLAVITETKTVGGNTFSIIDLCDVTGVPCFEQNLDTRITTVAGTNLLFETRGIPSAVGMADTLPNEAAFLVAVQTELKSDDRVAVVRNLSARCDGNHWQWEGTIVLRNATEILTGGQA
jgi:hypothetical protein